MNDITGSVRPKRTPKPLATTGFRFIKKKRTRGISKREYDITGYVASVVCNTKCHLNKEFIFYSRNFVTVYMNNEIPKSLVFNALTPTWVLFLSIPVVGNPVLSSDAKCM